MAQHLLRFRSMQPVHAKRRSGGVTAAALCTSALATALHLLSTLAVHASPAAGLTGCVTSQTGEPLPGAAVTASSAALIQPRSIKVDADGCYVLMSLPPGRYEMTFSAHGHQSLSRPAIVEVGRVNRAEASLEASEDEESVTSTARSAQARDHAEPSVHFSSTELERLPVARDPVSLIRLVPLISGAEPNTEIDGVVVDGSRLLVPEEGVREATIFRDGTPLLTGSPAPVRMTWARGGERRTVSVRATYSNRDGRSGVALESAAGGRIVPGRLWFFASGAGGDDRFRDATQMRGVVLSLAAQPLAGTSGEARHFDFDDSSGGTRFTSLHLTHLLSDLALLNASAARVAEPASERTQLRGSASRAFAGGLGRHVVTAGVARGELARQGARNRFFAGDHWESRRWSVDAVLSHAGALAAQLRATRTIGFTGRYALTAAHERLDTRRSATSAGWLALLGSSGSARVDLVRHRFQDDTGYELLADARYRLFDRYEAGASIRRTSFDGVTTVGIPQQNGHVRVAGQFDFASSRLEVVLAEEFATFGGQEGTLWGTLAGLRLGVPASRTLWTAGVDFTTTPAESANYDDGERVRFWVRASF